jgi:hypothetical protein
MSCVPDKHVGWVRRSLLRRNPPNDQSNPCLLPLRGYRWVRRSATLTHPTRATRAKTAPDKHVGWVRRSPVRRNPPNDQSNRHPLSLRGHRWVRRSASLTHPTRAKTDHVGWVRRGLLRRNPPNHQTNRRPLSLRHHRWVRRSASLTRPTRATRARKAERKTDAC